MGIVPYSRKIGGELNLAVRADYHQIKVRQYFLLAYNMQYHTEPTNLYLPIFSLELILGDPPNLITIKFSGYTAS